MNQQSSSSIQSHAVKGRHPTSYLLIPFIEADKPFSFYKSFANFSKGMKDNRVSNVVGLLGNITIEILNNLFDIPPPDTSILEAISIPNNSMFSSSMEYIPNNANNPQTSLFIYSTLSESILSSGLSTSDISESFVALLQEDKSKKEKEGVLHKAIKNDENTKYFIKNFFLTYANIIIYFTKGYDLKSMIDINSLKSYSKPNTQIIVVHLFDNVKDFSKEYQQFENTSTLQKMYFTYALNDYIEGSNDYKELFNTYFIEFFSNSNNQIVHLFYLNEFKDILKLFLRQRIVYSSVPQEFELVKEFENFINQSKFLSKYGCPNAKVQITESKQSKDGYGGEKGKMKIDNIENFNIPSSISLYANAFQLKTTGPLLTENSLIIEFEYPLCGKDENIIDILNKKSKTGKDNRVCVENMILEKANYVIRINGYKKLIKDEYNFDTDNTVMSTIEQGEFFSHIDVPYVVNNELVILLDQPKIEPVIMKNKENEDITKSYSGILKVTFPRIKLNENVVKIN